MTPFIVFSLPRSRSAWLSVVLSASGHLVGHDIGIESDTPDDFINNLISRGGTCETGAQFAWKEIRRKLPNTKFVVVLRDPDEVINSLEQKGVTDCSEEIYKRYDQLLEIAEQPNVFVCDYEDLNNSNIVSRLYKFCTGLDVPLVWVDKLQGMNIQIDLEERFKLLESRRDEIAELKRLVSDKSGYQFEVEPWSEQFWSDAKGCAESHFEEVDGGIEPNREFLLDEGLMQAMHDSGSLMIITARKDDKFIGYFTWQIMPDVESKGLLIAQQGAWYVSPGNPKAAVKLFDKSIEELQLRGVKCVFPHHRLQGRGANLGKFFKKRGAKLIQHTYSLWIGE